LALISAAALAQDAGNIGEDAARRQIEDLGLIEAPRALRESAAWKKPERVLAFRAPEALRESLRLAAPGVEILWAANAQEYVERAPLADVVLGPCSPDMVAAAKRLRWLQSFSAGVESCIAQEPLRNGTVILTNMQRIGAPVMADHVMAMLLSFSRNLPQYHDAQRDAKWVAHRDVGGAFGLAGKTMFIAGLGGTGLEIAKRAKGFGMRVTGTRNSARTAPDYVDYVGLPQDMPRLLADADVVVNALPLTSSTRGVFDAAAFNAMKRGAWFINVGRGTTVVTAALVQALQDRKLAGAGLDVVDPEPLPPEHALWKMPNVIITPHIAADISEYDEPRWVLARENLRRYVAGDRLLSVVDPQRGY